MTTEAKCKREAGYSAVNRTRGVLLAAQAELAETPWARMRGLLGRPAAQFAEGKGLWVTPSEGIHTIGMAFPIDVVYLDACGRILRLYHKLLPFRIGAISFKARSVLELPAGTLERTGTQVGDVVEFQPNHAEQGVRCAIE